MDERFASLDRLRGPRGIRHPEGWEVRRPDRHRLEYRDAQGTARVHVEDLVGGIAISAQGIEWEPATPGTPLPPLADLLARCGLAEAAESSGDVVIEWGMPRWGRTAPDEAYCFEARCVVRVRPVEGVADYEDAMTREQILVDREHGAWLLRKRPGEDQVVDRVVEALLFLTGEPVSVEIAD